MGSFFKSGFALRLPSWGGTGSGAACGLVDDNGAEPRVVQTQAVGAAGRTQASSKPGEAEELPLQAPGGRGGHRDGFGGPGFSSSFQSQPRSTAVDIDGNHDDMAEGNADGLGLVTIRKQALSEPGRKPPSGTVTSYLAAEPAMASSTGRGPNASGRRVVRRWGYFVEEEVVEGGRNGSNNGTPLGLVEFPPRVPHDMDKVVNTVSMISDAGHQRRTMVAMGQADNLAATAPPYPQGSMLRSIGPGSRGVDVPVEVVATSKSRGTKDATPEEGSWRVRHERADDASMPTALRSRPDPSAPPLKDIMVAPREEIVVRNSQGAAQNATGWIHVVCAKGEGWLKREHVREGGWKMRHVRGDNAALPTALRERPTSRSKPLEALKAEAREEVLVHVQLEVIEGGRPSTWARVVCSCGEGWLKREHLQDIGEKGQKSAHAEEGASTTALSSPRSLPGGDTPPSPHIAPMGQLRKMFQQSGHSPGPSPMESVVVVEGPPRGIRVRLGTLEFNNASVGTTGMFASVKFRAYVQPGGYLIEPGAPAPRWFEGGPATEPQTLTFGRNISPEGRYITRFACDFDEEVDLPWPPPGMQTPPTRLAVDIWVERTTVVDKLDRALGTLGFHTPAGVDRQWLGRAVLDLPPEGSGEGVLMPLAVTDAGGSRGDGPVPQTMSVGVEWLAELLDEEV